MSILSSEYGDPAGKSWIVGRHLGCTLGGLLPLGICCPVRSQNCPSRRPRGWKHNVTPFHNRVAAGLRAGVGKSVPSSQQSARGALEKHTRACYSACLGLNSFTGYLVVLTRSMEHIYLCLCACKHSGWAKGSIYSLTPVSGCTCNALIKY